MSKLKQWIIMLGVILAVGVGAFLCGTYSSNASHSRQLDDSTKNQMIAEQKFGNQLKAERFVKVVQQDTELTLITENGISNMKINKFADGWNKWLTNSDIEMSLEYSAKVSIKTDDIVFFPKDDGSLMVVVDKDDIEVSSVEIVNKNILLSRSIFGEAFSEDEKVVLEKQMVQQVRDKILTDSTTMTEARESLYNYLIDLGNTFNVNLEVVYK